MQTNSVLKTFIDNFNRSDNFIHPAIEDFEPIERQFNIYLPVIYKEFLTSYGYVYTPNILDLIIKQKKDIHDLQNLIELGILISINNNYWNAGMSKDLFGFANDCMGNMFCFKISDLKVKSFDNRIYFFDHENSNDSEIFDSFIAMIEEFNTLKF